MLETRGWSLFFNKVRSATLLEKRLQHRCFPVNIAKFLRTYFFNRTTPVAAFEGLQYASQCFSLFYYYTDIVNESDFVRNFKEVYNKFV